MLIILVVKQKVKVKEPRVKIKVKEGGDVGMAAGVGLNSVALIGTLFISLIIILLDNIGFGRPARLKHLLQVTHAGTPEAESALKKVLRSYCKRIQLINIRQLNGNHEVESFYHLSLRNKSQQDEFIRALRELPEVSQVNLFFEEEDNGFPIG